MCHTTHTHTHTHTHTVAYEQLEIPHTVVGASESTDTDPTVSLTIERNDQGITDVYAVIVQGAKQNQKTLFWTYVLISVCF
jgi:hypothetical protein